MIKRLLFCCTFLMLIAVSDAQKIAKVKMEDVVKSFSANNDTTYVVNFWATFCKPCIEEIPDFIKITERYKSKKVKLLLVSLDLPAFYPARIAAFVKKNNYNTNHAWLNETNADIFCPMIDPKWSGAIPATLIVNNKTGYKKFTEAQISAEDFEKSLKEAIGGNAMNKYVAPMNDAGIDDYQSRQAKRVFPSHGDGNYVTTFKSNDSSVYSITGGKVSTVVRIDDIKVVIIQNEKMFYTYSNLGSTKIKTGDVVKPNQLIGFATNDFDEDKPTLELYVSDDDGKGIILSKGNFIERKIN
ncbi:MAG: redoxin domain-containing protein [Ferruginibacter sp.]|nr:redoxin domain-containing protein [Ferruginibacter sp.]